tara:strand:- start:241 stop:369 length:129 start_codon:yes stop_codon:yes gene_type:complete
MGLNQAQINVKNCECHEARYDEYVKRSDAVEYALVKAGIDFN